MAMWDGSYSKPVEEWVWKKRRVWRPFLQCERSHKFLFLKKAYYGKRPIYNTFFKEKDYHDMWLSKEEYLFAILKDDFDETSS